MLIKKVTVQGYKYIAHAGTSFISISNIKDVLVFIGGNGSGKSTLLKEITPFPSVSTEYEDGGYKEIELEHSGSLYIIRSSFDGKKGIHSFIKDDVELNESHTSIVQTDLCVSELGLTPIIKSIISEVVELCQMGRAERKQFLLSCYPSNLSFVLNHHKRIVSEIKSTKDNLKMLSLRKAELEDVLMPDEAYQHMCDNMQTLISIKADVDKAEFLYLEEIKRMKRHPQCNPSIINLDYVQIQSRLNDLYAKCVHYRLNYPELFKRSYQEELVKLNTSKEYLGSSLNTICESIHSITLEIEQFERMSLEVSEERIKGYENTINKLHEEIGKITIEQNLPVLTPESIRDIDLNVVKDKLSQIHCSGRHILTRDQANEIISELHVLHQKKISLDRELTQVNTTLKNTQSRLERFKTAEFRVNCLLECPAREKYTESLSSLQDEEIRLLEVIEEYDSNLIHVTQEIREKEEFLRDATLNMPNVMYISDLLYDLKLYEYIVGEHVFHELLSGTPMLIYNQLSRIVENSINVHNLKEFKDKLEETEARLSSILEAKKETVGLMGQSIVTKRSGLAILGDQHVLTQHKLDHIEKDIVLYDDVKNMSNDIVELKAQYDNDIIAHIINKKIELLTQIVKDVVVYKSIVEDEQLVIKSTIKEKESIKVRLEEEILPSIKKLTDECTRLEHLEKALSPTSGIPHIYMVRFINNIITSMNTIISQVWTYDMELLLLDESKHLDFDFPVRLYKNKDRDIKDVSLLSKAQKEMTNLAFTIALFIIMKLGDKYPLKLDEADSGFCEAYRSNLLTLFSSLLTTGDIKQLFIINHFHSLVSAFQDTQIVCLNSEGILLPSVYNTDTIIK